MSLVFSTEINSGYVFSNYGEPVPFASVVNIRTKSWSITDESGFYQLPLGTLPTDSLKISKIGFSSSFHLPQEQKHRKIVLSQEVIVLDPITIVGEKNRLDNFLSTQKYNKEITFPFKYSAEKFYRKSKIYDLLIHIKYNHTPTIKKRGSAIFLHLTEKKNKPTEGCIAISKKDFLKILPLINKNTKISIG